MRNHLLFSALLVFTACGSEITTPGDGGPDGGSPDGCVCLPPDLAMPDMAQIAPAPGCPAVSSDPTIQQALPAATVDTTPPPTGRVVTVNSGDNLQQAIDNAMPGDTLELAAGATFMGPITLRAKTGTGWIVIRTSTPDSQFAMPGTRVTPALAPKMARIVGPSAPNTINVDKGAGFYRLVGLEITAAPNVYLYASVDLTVSTTSDADLAHDIIVDRCWLHADPVGGRRGVALNSKSSAVVDSYLSGYREKGADSQAIAGWAGPGPYLIRDNYLEGASENVIFGGSDPSIANLVPSDITICENHIKKDPTWQGGGWVAKNLLELKNAHRVLVAGNVMEYSWADGQVGFGVLFTPRNQDGTAPWSGVQDATVAYNVVRHTGSGVNLLASDDTNPSQPLARIVVRDNLFDDIDPAKYGGDGRAWQFVYGAGGGSDIAILHNTTTTDQNAALTLGDTAKYGTNFIFRDNLVPHGSYGVFGSGQAEGKTALDYYLQSYSFDHNAIFGGGKASAYPAGNFFPAMQSDVGFNTDWSLTSSSPYKGAGSDGKDLGADIAGITTATTGVAP